VLINTLICKLRKKLAEAGAANVIGTVWGRGYMIRDVAAPVYPAAPAHHALPVRHAAPARGRLVNA